MSYPVTTTRGPIVVTGAGGFLGRTVCAQLVSSGMRVRGVHRPGTAVPFGTESMVAADLADRQALRHALNGSSTVVHLAARVHVMDERSKDALEVYRQTNVIGTALVLKEAIAAGVSQFIFASSVKAMGECTEIPWTEVTPARPVDPYGLSKLEAEQLIAAAAYEGLDCVSLRFPAMYGPGVRANLLRLIELVERGMPIPLGCVTNKRSLLYVGNASAAIHRLIEAKPPGARTYLLSDGDDLSTPDFIRMIADALGRPARLVDVPVALLHAAGILGDILGTAMPIQLTTAALTRLTSSLQVDSTRFARDFDFEMPFTVKQGLRDTIAWFRSTARIR